MTRISTATEMTSPANADIMPVLDASASNALQQVTLQTLATFFGASSGALTEFITHTVAGAVTLSEKVTIIYAAANVTLPDIDDNIHVVIIYADGTNRTVSADGSDAFYKGTSTANSFTLTAHNACVLVNTPTAYNFWVPVTGLFDLTGF